VHATGALAIWLFGVMLAQVRAFGYAGVGVGRLLEVAEGYSCGLVQVLAQAGASLARVWRESGASCSRSWTKLSPILSRCRQLDAYDRRCGSTNFTKRCRRGPPPALLASESSDASQPASHATPASQPRNATPASQPRNATPASQPRNATPASQPRNATAGHVLGVEAVGHAFA
jgi:hypothetical protein